MFSGQDESAQLAQERLRHDRAHPHSSVLKALLSLDGADDSLAHLLQALRSVFPFDQAIVLREQDASLRCIAAAPPHPIGRSWPLGPFLESVVLGRVLAPASHRDAKDHPDIPPDLIPLSQAALCFPIGLRDQRGALIMLQAASRGGFGAAHIAFARQCAVVSLAGLAVRNGNKLESENQRLNLLVAQSRQSEQDTQQDNRLLQEIVDHLPIALTVQDSEGRFILVNSVAAANLAMPAEALIGASPADFLPPEDAAHRREWETTLIKSGRMNTVEESITGQAEQQTWLTSHKPVNILGQSLLVTSSLNITDRKHVEIDLAKRVHFDELTGFPNRILIQSHVEQAIHRRGRNERFALAFIDLDNFKHINDYYSHAIGDALLVKIARRIAERLRESDMLARISGDEFLLFLDPVTHEDEIRVIVDGVLDSLKQPFQIEAFEVFTSASIGVSIYPEHGSNYEELRRNADNAMYRAKADTKGNAIYFDTHMGRSITARMESEQRLRLAIRDRRFVCAFQPKVDIRSQEVVGFETLVRWRDNDGEIHPPTSFVGLAVELGVIDPITHFVLAEALDSMEHLDKSFGPGTTISVNIAAKQASDLTFMRSIIDKLKRSERADRIMLELTEDAFIAKNQFQTLVLPMLREIGVRVSIDDFGTGYSSLSALADITADEIKVDRSFISSIQERPRSQSILRTIESLSQALGMTIVAEGVETFEEVAYLQAATRIRYAQGYYFSKPFFLEDAMGAMRMSFDGRTATALRERPDQRGPQSAREAG